METVTYYSMLYRAVSTADTLTLRLSSYTFELNSREPNVLSIQVQYPVFERGSMGWLEHAEIVAVEYDKNVVRVFTMDDDEPISIRGSDVRVLGESYDRDDCLQHITELTSSLENTDARAATLDKRIKAALAVLSKHRNATELMAGHPVSKERMAMTHANLLQRLERALTADSDEACPNQPDASHARD